jgi:hypothetical protein
MKKIRSVLFFCFILFAYNPVLAQNDVSSCKVELYDLQGKYAGECKDGYADGKGEATGNHRYTGSFKKGFPNGKGSYYYSDSVFFTGNFQRGVKEGKGEMHFTRTGLPDSIVKGYWSGDEYQGSRYVTYSFATTQVLASSDIQPLSENDNTITIIITTTTGSPDGTIKHSLTGSTGTGLSLQDLAAVDGTFLRKKTSSLSGRAASVTYEIPKFPIKLIGTISNGKTFELDLYKASGWRVNLVVNE